jgi:hypothetical protein
VTKSNEKRQRGKKEERRAVSNSNQKISIVLSLSSEEYYTLQFISLVLLKLILKAGQYDCSLGVCLYRKTTLPGVSIIGHSRVLSLILFNGTKLSLFVIETWQPTISYKKKKKWRLNGYNLS